MRFDEKEQDHLIRDIEESLNSALPLYLSLEGVIGKEERDLLWIMTPGRNDGHNLIAKVRLDPGAAALRVDEMVDKYRKKDLCSSWFVDPSAQPEELPKILAERGFKEVERLYGMALALDGALPEEAVPEGLSLEPILDLGRLEEMMEMFSAAAGSTPLEGKQELEVLKLFGVGPESPFKHWAGLLEGRIVTSTSYYPQGVTAVMDCVSTSPDQRGRGLAKAVFTTALRRARDQGYERSVLVATEMGRPLYRSLGFDELCRFYVWSDRPPKED